MALLGTAHIQDELVALVLDRADGVPFFLEELVQTLLETGAIEQHEGQWRLTAQATALTAAMVLLLRSRAVNSAWQRLSMLLPFASTCVLLVWYHATHTNWQNRLGTVLPLVGAAALAVVLSLAMPGRRIHPVSLKLSWSSF